MPATVSVRWVENGALREGGLSDVAVARAAGTVWIDVFQPDVESLAALQVEFDLHPLAVEDCLHFPQRPKLDPYGSTFFLVWVLPHLHLNDQMAYDELDIFLGNGFLITSHRDPLGLLDEVARIAQAVLPRGAEWTLHSLLDRATDGLFPSVDYISDQLDSIEDQLLESADRQQLHRLYTMKRLLVALHKVIGPERDSVRAMARQTELVSQEAYLYFQDVGDHLARVADAVDTYRDVASGAMDIYLSAVNNRMNEIMKQLTVVATIFMPLTLMSGIYGMNITEGMWPPITAVWSFGLVIFTMIAIAVGMLVFFRRRNWW
jgi:magnesium transporter